MFVNFPLTIPLFAVMLNNMFITFTLRIERANTIYAQFTVKKKTRKYTTYLKCAPSDWNEAKECVKGKSDFAQNTNNHLTILRNRFTQLHINAEAQGRSLTMKQVVAYVLRSEPLDPPAPLLLTYYDAFVQTKKERNWRIRYKQIEEALAAIGQASIKIDEVRLSLAYLLWDQLTIKKGYGHRSAKRSVNNLASCFNFAMSRGVIDANPFAGFKPDLPTLPKPKYLTEADLKMLSEYSFEFETDKRSRDIFIILCYTGFLHTDYKQLRAGKVKVEDRDGRQWLTGARQKGQGERRYGSFSLPLHIEARKIIDKYGGVSGLPMINASKINKNFKEAIPEGTFQHAITTKLGRSTFAHHALNTWHIPLETVSAMMGHSDTSTTLRYYAKVQDSKIAHDTAGKI